MATDDLVMQGTIVLIIFILDYFGFNTKSINTKSKIII